MSVADMGFSPSSFDTRPPDPSSLGLVTSRWFGELELCFEVREGRTVLAHQRHVGPLLVQRPFYPEADGTCHVYLLHPPGGVAGGDVLDTRIHMGTSTRTLLTTPGATKFYRSAHGGGEQRLSIDVGKDGICEYLPQETIMFDGADASMDMRIDLAVGARYLGWDFLSLGRPAAGEKFSRGRIRQRVQVFEDGKPIWFEQLQLTGGSPLSLASYALAAQPIIGTMIYVGETPGECTERVREAIGEGAQGRFSVSQLERAVVCRYLGPRVSEAKSLFSGAWNAMRTACQGKPANAPRIWAT